MRLLFQPIAGYQIFQFTRKKSLTERGTGLGKRGFETFDPPSLEDVRGFVR